MANKLKVEELREQLSKRGLPTTGIKPTLVKRLESAIRKDSVPGGDSNTRLEKRARDESQDQELNNESNRIRAVDELKNVSIQELRKEAENRGISTSGTKKELLERFCNDIEVKPVNDLKNASIKELRKEAENRGVSTTGTKKELLERLCNGSEMNTKDIVTESDDGSRYMVYNRWGRVGIKGQDKLHGPYTSVQSAIDEFEQKFLAKTRNYWSDRKQFVSHHKCYTWLEMDYNEAGKETDALEKLNSKLEIQPRETKLEARVAKFISLICNVSMMKQQMMEIGYNAEKLPLGKLSKATISKGYEVLKRVADVIGQHDRKKLEQLSGEFYTIIPHDFGFKKMREFVIDTPQKLKRKLEMGYEVLKRVADVIGQHDRKKLEQLSGEFYTIIPHDFGFKKMREFVIDTPQKLKRKLEMVEALGEIEVATKLLEDNAGSLEDPILARYESLQCELTPVDVDSKEFHMITKYMKNTHAKTHTNYSVEIVQIFRTTRHGEAGRFSKFSNTKNRMLLWHGSRLSNWTGILSQGLRIAPPEAPVTGYMFGKGVYFADMFSKSANYCCASQQASAGVLLLCEVALGEMAELLNADHNADKLPQGKLSTKGVGATAPDMSEIETLEDGVVVPLGQPKQQLKSKASLLYNEYIAYNVDQIRMRYIIHVNFNFK
ncbi:Poly [Artemisia annua]|uniref:Poly [ADP-ribose] polymerase n=1 Tax=Artemisia annua TaxID=35608 RepID=A0A2U1Q285_ARTAN|nr:Poly [Artemisia annua]